METSENIRVYARVRPLPVGKEGERPVWKISQDKSSIANVDADKDPYVLDTVFDHNDSTKTVYEGTTKSLIREVVDGFNSTVFAYGQTSSGKTHTMRGTDSEPGIIPLAIRELFDIIAGEERDFSVRVSYMEIYNEDIRDLLVPGDQKLAIKQSTNGIVVSGLKEEPVTELEEVMKYVELGDAQRHVGETKMNARSSRSHAIFRMVVESSSPSSSGVRVSSLNLVDLAGSERISKTGAEGQRQKEGAAINKSLLTLGTVISKLSEGASHVPYRDSKLTRILQSSLGGNAKTAMICAITPASEHTDESHCSLAFACRAKTIVNNACVNEVLSDSALLRKQAQEIEALKSRLQTGNSGHIDEDAVRRKIQSITRMLLNNQHIDSSQVSFRQEDRRKTWCPDVCTQKRQSDAPYLTTEKRLRRISDGHLLLEGQEERMMSMHHADITTARADSPEDSESSLQKQVLSLKNANQLLQKQLDAMVDVVQKKREELQSAENDMKKIAQEKGSVLPALKEAQWKNRQLEKDVIQHKQKLEEALERIMSKDLEYTKILEEKDSMLKEAQECAKQAMCQMQSRETQFESGSGSTKDLIDVRAELDTLRLKFDRMLEAKENLSTELNTKTEEVDLLKAQLADTGRAKDKSKKHEQEMLEEIERLKAHVQDLEKRKRAPLYQKKQDAELEAAKSRAAKAEARVEEVEEEANKVKEQMKEMKKDVSKIREDYEARIVDLTDESLALTKKLDAALEAASGHQAQSVLEADKETIMRQVADLKESIEEKDRAIESTETELGQARSECKQLRAQLEEVQACADAASAHVRFLEDKAEEENQEANLCVQELERRHEEKVRAMEKVLRDQEDMCEKSKLELNALETENTSLKERNDSLEKRVELASSTLNAIDELRELKKKHKEEVAKLNSQLRQASVGSKGNERAVERAAKDSNRLKNQIHDLETKLKKAVAEKSALQSEKAALDREHRTAKASLEKLNKNANRAAAVEERKRQPIVKELEDAKAKLTSVEEELYACKESLERSEERATMLEQTLEGEQAKISDLETALEDQKQDIEDLNIRYDELDCVYRETQDNFEAAHIRAASTEEALKEANKNVAKLNEQIRGLKNNLEQTLREKQEVQEHLESVQQDKKSLETALSDAETRVEMMDALQMDLDSEKAHVSTLQQNFKIMEKGLEDHKKELESFKEKNTCLNHELEKAQKSLAEKEEYVSSLENQVNDLMAKSMEMEASLEASKCEYKKTKSLLSQAENVIEEHENTITEVHAERIKVEKELRESTEHCEKLEQELKTVKETFDEKVKSMEETSASEKSRVEELQKASRDLEDGLNKQRANLIEQIQGLKDNVEALQSSLQDLENEKSRKQSEYDAERKELVSSLERAKTEHSKSLEALQKQLKDSKQAIIDTSEIIKVKEEEIQELRKNIEDLRIQSDVLTGEKLAALDVNACLKTEIERFREELNKVMSSQKTYTSSTIDASLMEKYQSLEKELRRSKRREEKLQALQYRLQQDVKKAGGSMEAFKNLRDVRSLEYELDRTANRAEKEIQALKKALAAKNCGVSQVEQSIRNPLSQKNT